MWAFWSPIKPFYRVFMDRRVATVMKISWNSWNFKNFWKSHGILTKIGKGHGKVMEF